MISTTTAMLLLVASPVSAHVDPDPAEAQAGSRLSVGFTVQHGCDGSPTVQLDMRLPDGVSGAQPEAPDGWTGTIDSDVITFTGGPLPDDRELTFRVLMTLPPTPDTTIYFPFVQRCEVGEIRWIAIPSDGSGTELDEPAPAMQLTGPAVTTTTAAPATAAPPTLASSTTSESTKIDATTSSSSAASAESGNDAGSIAGTLIFVGALATIAVFASMLVVRSRRQR